MNLVDTPENEVERLADLRTLNILNTPPEERFDRIARLASHVQDAPIAYIAMIDSDQQWLKARCGIARDSIGRDVSFCTHAIMRNTPLIIADTLADERFRNNPLVTGEPYIRFYAGHPLRGPRGHNVGTLCVADHQPRSFDARQRKTLAQLADLAEHELNLEGFIASQRELLETQRALLGTQKRLAAELTEAAEYVRALLPERLNDGPVRTDWLFLASEQLGGDTFGYHWLDSGQLAMYVVDVTGHGVGSALLSVSVLNALRRHTLPDTPFDEPGEVLTSLNRTYPMEASGGKFSTIWYGVYDFGRRRLRYASAGHPPAVLLNGSRAGTRKLGEPNFMIGVVPDVRFETSSFDVPEQSRIYLYSDGAIETFREGDDEPLGVDGLVDVLQRQTHLPRPRVGAILQALQQWQGRKRFEDDVTLLEVELP